MVNLPNLALDWIRCQGVQFLPPFVVYPGLTTQWILTWRWTGKTLGPLWTRSQSRGTAGELHVCGSILGLACFHTWPHLFEILPPTHGVCLWFGYSFLVSSLVFNQQMSSKCWLFEADTGPRCQRCDIDQRYLRPYSPAAYGRPPKPFFSLWNDAHASQHLGPVLQSLGSVICLPGLHSLPMCFSQTDFQLRSLCRVVELCVHTQPLAHSLH